jgi:hypothetical protein
MTVIEIRSHRWGWKVFEASGVERFLDQEQVVELESMRVFRLDKLAKCFRNSRDMKLTVPSVVITFALVCFGLLPKAHAVIPLPDGGYPGGNTAEGQNALFGLSTGGYNTAVGFLSLTNNTTFSGVMHFAPNIYTATSTRTMSFAIIKYVD